MVEIVGLEEVVRRVVREELDARADAWLTAEQAAERIGCSPATIHNLVSAGRLPRHGERGHALRFRAAEVDAATAVAITLIASRRKPAQVKEIIAEALADPRSRPMAGATPAATIAARLYTAAKKGTVVKTLDGVEGVLHKSERGKMTFKRAGR